MFVFLLILDFLLFYWILLWIYDNKFYKIRFYVGNYYVEFDFCGDWVFI